MLSGVDLGIVAAYFVLMLLLGLWVRKRAASSVESYFLGGRRIPWWLLGLSGGASWFDVAGLMLVTSLLIQIGVRGIWFLWVCSLTVAAFWMTYLGKWIRRSNVLTGAEWMRTRFGEDRAGEMARLAYSIVAVVTVVAFLSYGAVAIGKFAAAYLPWSSQVCMLAILLATGVYVVLGGLFSVVFTDIAQTVLMLTTAIVLTVVAFQQTTASEIARNVPAGWSTLTPSWSPEYLAGTPYRLFGVLCIIWVAKGLLLNVGGPQQLYDFQRFLAARDAREACKLGALWGMVPAVMWLIPIAIATLAVVKFQNISDPEKMLPLIIGRYVPIGLRGVVIAGLMAAFMSTFDSTVNSGAAYIVRDWYQKYVNPEASPKRLVFTGYAASAILILASMAIALHLDSVETAFNWIMLSLGAGVLLPNVLRWYWWRYNGWGFTSGVLAGVVFSLVQLLAFTEAPAHHYFPIISGGVLAVSILTTLLTPPSADAVLVEFYRSIQPGGFWGPIKAKVAAIDPEFEKRKVFRADLLNAIVAMPFFICIYLTPIYLVLRMYRNLTLCVVIAFFLAVVLYFRWYKRLPEAGGPVPCR